MPAANDLTEVASNRELRRRRWWHRIEQLVPMMLDKAEQDGGIVVANLGQKCLPEGRVVLVHTSSQACAAGCRWGA